MTLKYKTAFLNIKLIQQLASSLKLDASYLRIIVYPCLISLISILGFNGCVKENTVPAYLHITNFSLTTKVGEGSSAQKITDAWVYVDGIINGVFQLPVTIPVTELGKREISIFTGIRNNGTRSNPIIYPFYNPYKITLDLKADKVDTLRPTTTYIATTQFKIMDNFESGTIFTTDKDGNTSLRFTTIDNGFEGKSGQITLTKTNALMEKASSIKTNLSDISDNIFLELNYKTEAPLSVGLIGSDPATNPTGTSSYKIILSPNKEWNKTYLNLTNEVKDLRMKDFQIVFKSILPEDLSTATILIDNVKLIQK
jgi:hypothetical protein